jgi:hypothetical protein
MSEEKTDKIYSEKLAQLEKFLDGISAPVQKSKEWYAIKQTTIGGSEIATVLGYNPYRKVKDLIAEKIGIGSNFVGNTATRWGNLFENVTKRWGEIIFKMSDPIKETGSVKGVIDRQRYSPDGLGIVQLLCTDGTYEYFVILFEFKAPLSTLPTGKIPKHYLPQIQTGMLSIPLSDTSIFINNCYRKCKLADLQFNGAYDTTFHYSDYKKLKHGLTNVDPFACGLICFYQTLEDYHKLYDYLGYKSDDESNDEKNDIGIFDDVENMLHGISSESDRYYVDGDMPLLLDTRDNPIDIGAADSDVLDRVLELHDNKRIKAIYYPIIVNSTRVNNMELVKMHNLEREENNINPNKLAKIYLQRFMDKCDENDWCTVGYLPWKLQRSDIIITDRDEQWLEKIEKPVKETLAIIDEIAKSKDKTEAFFKKFPEPESEMIGDLDEMDSMVISCKSKTADGTTDNNNVEEMVILDD